MITPLLNVKNLSKKFGDKIVLDKISFQLNPEETLGIIGASGSGKSVLLKCILGLIDKDKGDITHDESHPIGMLFQGGALFDSLTVWENVAFSLLYQKRIDKKNAKKIALEKLDLVNLPKHVADLYPSETSGGMQKRIALARAIANDPRIIFFDEPTTGLDPIVSNHINELMVQCVKKLKASNIIITHDINSLKQVANRVGLLFKGELIWIGTIQEMETTDNPYVVQFINGFKKGPFTD
jgi:phospholipid/cholesterol/gamma-HCH transport system ATP-binding protein